MKLKFLGHASFMITHGDKVIVTDPYITGNPLAKAHLDEIHPTHILLSHAHGDHIGDTIALAKKNKARVLCTVETAQGAIDSSINTIAYNIGGTVDLGFARVKMVSAVHGSGVKGGLSCGFLITIDNIKIYFAGDTALTYDMALLEYEGVDYALLPIGGMYTMDPEDACRATDFIKPKYVIPMHYNTFPSINQRPQEFRSTVEKKTNSKVLILSPDDEIEI